MAQGHFARLTALALATGTLVAVSAAPAGAALDTERVYNATSSGMVLQVEINLPAGIPGVVPQNIKQDIVLSQGAARTGSSVAAVGSAFLGQNGNVDVLQGLLKGQTISTLDKAGEPYRLLEVPANPLGLTGGLLQATSKVANPNVDGTLSESASSIASLELEATGVLGAVLAPVEAVLAQALGATAAAPAAGPRSGSPAAPVTETVEGVLGTALDALDGVTQGTTAPVSDQTRAAVETLTATINQLLADLNNQVLNISANDTLLDVGLVETSQSVTRKAGTVTSQVNNKLVGIDLLGGLVNVSGIESSALASLGDSTVPAADANATILKANISDLLSLEIADTLRAQLGGTVGGALPPAVLDTVNQAVAAVTALLADTLGLRIGQAEFEESKSADAATARTGGAQLVLDPLRNPAAPLLRIGFVPAEATVKAQSFTSTPTFVPADTPVNLPRTGGEEALAAVAISLMAGALVIRRRRATV